MQFHMIENILTVLIIDQSFFPSLNFMVKNTSEYSLVLELILDIKLVYVLHTVTVYFCSQFLFILFIILFYFLIRKFLNSTSHPKH